ncbi:S-protein homolog 5-like [Henckelia pumila]|uniref:S-protein homolog 5-like n=1 Tax=Henckelia pumila TaxID=405737 RepID=UPI003C6E45D9
MVPTSEGHGVTLFHRTDVAIVNQIQSENITIHCYTSDDDIGTHVLSFDQNISWSFEVNFFLTTKFYCDFTTDSGRGNYAVYDRKLEIRCDEKCVWNVRERGPCLIQNSLLLPGMVPRLETFHSDLNFILFFRKL